MPISHTPTGHKPPTERSFGILFAAVFSGVGFYAYYKNWHQYAVAASFLISGLLLLTSFLASKLLTPFNKAWFWLGQTLGKIVSPIVLGIIFFLLITPVALVGKLFGRDELRLKKRSVNSFWIERKPPGPSSESFKNQF
jgi:hypothetical protein